MTFKDFSVDEEMYMSGKEEFAWDKLKKDLKDFEATNIDLFKIESLTYKCKKHAGGIYGGTIRLWYTTIHTAKIESLEKPLLMTYDKAIRSGLSAYEIAPTLIKH